jgi:G:T-mismatch repair DNA endonuclease (very short patch repair protein)
MARDQRALKELADAGWQTATVWECHTKESETLERLLREILATMSGEDRIGRSVRTDCDALADLKS